MSEKPYNTIDPDCPDVVTFLSQTETELEAARLRGIERHRALVERLDVFAITHKPTCARCEGFVSHFNDGVEEDGRSPIWGGATLGLLVGLIAAFFVGDQYWRTVLYAVGIGAALGILTNLQGLLLRVFRNRSQEGR